MRKRVASFGETILQGAKEAEAIARGEAVSTRVSRRFMSRRTTQVAEPPSYDSKRIRKLRIRLKMSQPVFARSLNASDATVKAWEQGKRVPEGTALRLLQMAEKEPQAFFEVAGIRDSTSSRRRGRGAGALRSKKKTA